MLEKSATSIQPSLNFRTAPRIVRWFDAEKTRRFDTAGTQSNGDILTDLLAFYKTRPHDDAADLSDAEIRMASKRSDSNDGRMNIPTSAATYRWFHSQPHYDSAGHKLTMGRLLIRIVDFWIANHDGAAASPKRGQPSDKLLSKKTA